MQKRNFLLLLFLTIFLAFKSFAEYNQEYLKFEINPKYNEVDIIGLNTANPDDLVGEVRIPAVFNIEDYSEPFYLFRVLDNVFVNCNNITSIVFEENPNGKNSLIFPKAFDNCINLERVDLSSSVETIYRTTFFNCPNIKTFIIRKSNDPISLGLGNESPTFADDAILYVPKSMVNEYQTKKENENTVGNKSSNPFFSLFKKIESIESLGEEENNGTDGNVIFVFDNYSVEFLNMKVGHQIIYSGCQVLESNNSEYSLENSTITIKKSGAVTIIASPIDAVTYNDETTRPTLRLGSATLQFPEMTTGDKFVVTVPEGESVKVSNGGTSVYDATNNTHTVTVSNHTNFSAATYSSDQSLIFDETVCQKPTITVENGHILIGGVVPDENINIIDITGRNISLGHRRSISLHPGLYIVMTSQGAVKVRL